MNKRSFIAAAAVLTAVLMITAVCAGSSGIGLREIISMIGNGSPDGKTYDVIMYIMILRIAGAWLCGAALAAAGLLLQVSSGNVLASPGIIGVNAGAGFFVVGAGVLFPAGAIYLKSGAAFLGALFASFLVYGLAKKTGSSKTTVIMAGVALTSLFSAGIDALITFFPDAVMDRTNFYLGGFGSVFGTSVWPMVPVIAAGAVIAALLSPRLNVLLLGDETAAGVGLNVDRCRFMCIMCAALLAAAAVSMAGLLGFVGLIVPHAVRFLVGNDYRTLVPCTMLGGGFFLLACDTLARLLFAPFEFPVGVMLSFLGAPFFLWLLIKRKRRLEL